MDITRDKLLAVLLDAVIMGERATAPWPEAHAALEAITKELVDKDETIRQWEANASYLLESTPRAVRVREGGGVESLMDSISLNYIALRDESGRLPK